MTVRSTFRGHHIYFDPGGEVWRYSDNDKPVPENWESRPCGHCGLDATPEGHDGCLGTLPEPVMNACCGHGNPGEAYVQFRQGETLRGDQAREWQEQFKEV